MAWPGLCNDDLLYGKLRETMPQSYNGHKDWNQVVALKRTNKCLVHLGIDFKFDAI